VEQRRFLAARIDHWARSRSLLLDRLIAGSTWLVFGSGSALVAGSVGFVLATATVLPLAVRRRWPTGVLTWSVAMFAVQLVVVRIPLPANIAQALVVYTVAAHVASLPVRLCALGAGVAGSLLGGLRWSTPPEYLANALGTGVFLAVLVVLVWVIGNLVRGRELNTRALREADARLAESRRQRVRYLAQQERVSAAREIHDVVAHSLTVVVVQADGAEYATEHAQPWDRADARAVLATIGRTARAALAEVRGVVDMLRDPEVCDDPADVRVGVADLSHLVDEVRAAGLTVVVDADSTAFQESPATVGFALLRVVRESLTNVLKHAGAGATARVAVKRTRAGVRVRVEDDGIGAAGTEPGHGIEGMRERLRAFGGELAVGPCPGGGFAVEATIPVTVR
jgi:signal transduction histidine kinase